MSVCTGRKAFVTGGASGIGAAIATALAREGAQVFVSDLDDARLGAFKADHPDIHIGCADVSNPEEIAQAVAEASRIMGGLDTLVNNAGIAGPTGPLEETDIAAFRKTLAINVEGPFLATSAAVPHLRRAGGGSIVNLASVAGRLGYPFRSAYSSSKWALIGLTKTWAMEFGPDDIRVNAILPGMVKGPRLDAVVAARAQALGVSHAEVEAGFLANVSLRRAIAADEVAALAVYLLSPAARSMTGQTISLDGNVEVAR